MLNLDLLGDNSQYRSLIRGVQISTMFLTASPGSDFKDKSTPDRIQAQNYLLFVSSHHGQSFVIL